MAMTDSLPLFPESEDSWPFADYAMPTRPWNRIILVGEAPGAEEARLGRPFVGRSGKLLDTMLEKVGIEREACIIANVFRYQPPKNKVDHFFSSRRAALAQNLSLAEKYGKFGSFLCRSDFATEIDHLSAFLTAQKPRIVMALGRTALWALTGENGLLEKIGQTLPCRLAPSIPVIPTYHPSFILRGNWGLQETWESHFAQAKKRAEAK